MELADEIVINAPRDRVYAALNDPEILKACIPGCEELIMHSPTDLEAKVVLKIGPVKARFGGKVTLDTAGAPAPSRCPARAAAERRALRGAART
jgi:uncharacterized protein